jgi:hypothetical protein
VTHAALLSDAVSLSPVGAGLEQNPLVHASPSAPLLEELSSAPPAPGGKESAGCFDADEIPWEAVQKNQVKQGDGPSGPDAVVANADSTSGEEYERIILNT